MRSGARFRPTFEVPCLLGRLVMTSCLVSNLRKRVVDRILVLGQRS